jgi:hypothetical protein
MVLLITTRTLSGNPRTLIDLALFYVLLMGL